MREDYTAVKTKDWYIDLVLTIASINDRLYKIEKKIEELQEELIEHEEKFEHIYGGD